MQEATNRLELKLRTVEGQYGDLQVRKHYHAPHIALNCFRDGPRAGHCHPQDEASDGTDRHTKNQGQAKPLHTV